MYSMFQCNWLNDPLVIKKKAFEWLIRYIGMVAIMVMWQDHLEEHFSFNQWRLCMKVNYNRWSCHDDNCVKMALS